MGRAEEAQTEAELGRALTTYAGRWVAVANRSVVEAATTLDELLERTKGQQQVSIFRVATTTGEGLTRLIDGLEIEVYSRFVASGVLEGIPVELLEGVLVGVSPHSPAHATVLRRLVRWLGEAPGWLQSQLPLEVPPDSVPEPDIALLAKEPPAGHHPQTGLLVVEVAVSSHAIDRGIKVELYGRAGVPFYWLVDVRARKVEVRSEPKAGGYGRCEIYGIGSRIPSPASGVEPVDVGWIFARVED
jgi:Uma2 family endonuclease